MLIRRQVEDYLKRSPLHKSVNSTHVAQYYKEVVPLPLVTKAVKYKTIKVFSSVFSGSTGSIVHNKLL